jgi:hypothetical protein
MSRNTGKRPHELALEILKPGVVVSPTELEKYVGNGPYAGKHIWFLRKLGHDISIQKNGRTVVSYIYNSGPVAPPQTMEVQQAAVVPAKVAANKVKKVAAVKGKKPKAPKKVVKGKKEDPVEKSFGSTGEVSSFSVDPDFDHVDLEDFKNLT